MRPGAVGRRGRTSAQRQTDGGAPPRCWPGFRLNERTCRGPGARRRPWSRRARRAPTLPLSEMAASWRSFTSSATRSSRHDRSWSFCVATCPSRRAPELPLHVLEQRPEVQRLVEVVGQQLQVQHLRFRARLVARWLAARTCRGSDWNMSFRSDRVGLLAPAHHVGVEPQVAVAGLAGADRRVRAGSRPPASRSASRPTWEISIQWRWPLLLASSRAIRLIAAQLVAAAAFDHFERVARGARRRRHAALRCRRHRSR